MQVKAHNKRMDLTVKSVTNFCYRKIFAPFYGQVMLALALKEMLSNE